jgi:hypothetical protein
MSDMLQLVGEFLVTYRQAEAYRTFSCAVSYVTT